MNCLYLMTCNEFTKIGVASAHDAGARRNEMQAGNPYLIEIKKTYLIENAHEVEAILHRYFASCRIRREWFLLPPGAGAVIEEAVGRVGVPALDRAQSSWAELSLRSRGYDQHGEKRFGFYRGRQSLPELGYITTMDLMAGQAARLRGD